MIWINSTSPLTFPENFTLVSSVFAVVTIEIVVVVAINSFGGGRINSVSSSSVHILPFRQSFIALIIPLEFLLNAQSHCWDTLFWQTACTLCALIWFNAPLPFIRVKMDHIKSSVIIPYKLHLNAYFDTKGQTRPTFPITNIICKQMANCITYSFCPKDFEGGGSPETQLLDLSTMLNNIAVSKLGQMSWRKKCEGGGLVVFQSLWLLKGN